MRSLLLILTLAAAALPGAVAHAAPTPAGPARASSPVESGTRRVRGLEGQVATAEASQRDLEKRYQTKADQVAKLKGQRRSWNRDRELRDLLGESKTMADQLEAGQRRLAGLRADLAAARRELVVAIDRELADTALVSTRRVTLLKLRATQVAQLPRTRKKVAVADVKLDPLDDPEDLEEKAQMVSESEAELEREAARMETRAHYFRRLSRLERGKRRSEEVEVFGDGPRRQSVRSDVRGSTADQETDVDSGFESPVVGAPANDDDSAGGIGGDPAPGEGNGGIGTAPPPAADVREESGIELTRVYADVVQPGTLDALRQADRTGTPEAKANAADAAAADLRARAQRLRRQKAEMLDRARRLRGHSPTP